MLSVKYCRRAKDKYNKKQAFRTFTDVFGDCCGEKQHRGMDLTRLQTSNKATVTGSRVNVLMICEDHA